MQAYTKQRKFAASITIVLLLLSWAALDDITTGREPNFIMEYAMLAITAIWLLSLLWEKIICRSL